MNYSKKPALNLQKGWENQTNVRILLMINVISCSTGICERSYLFSLRAGVDFRESFVFIVIPFHSIACCTSKYD